MIEKLRQDSYRRQPVRLRAKCVAKVKVPSLRKAITAYWISVGYDDRDIFKIALAHILIVSITSGGVALAEG